MTVRGPERIGRNADGGVHALPNGLLLRADIHRLYDAGYVTVTPDLRFRVSHDLADDFRGRPRVRALRRPRHHRAAYSARPARSGAARLTCGRGVPRLSVTHHDRSSSLSCTAALATLQDDMNETPEHNGGEVVLYSSPNGDVSLDVLVEHESVWLTQKQMSELFDRDQSVISRHVRKAFADDELSPESNVQKVHIASSDKPLTLYSLDAAIEEATPEDSSAVQTEGNRQIRRSFMPTTPGPRRACTTKPPF